MFTILIQDKQCGLNDIVGGIVDAYYTYCHFDKFKILIDHPSYYNLPAYLNILDNIVFLKPGEHTDKADIHFRANDGNKTSKFTHEQIHKVLSFKPGFLNLIQTFPSHIGVHFRHQMQEVHNGIYETQEVEEYKNNFFERVYNNNKKYLVVSDNICWQEIFKNYTNIICLTPMENINTKENKISQRGIYLEHSLKSICSLASCSEIIKSKGNFTNLVKIIIENKKIQRLHDKNIQLD